jgi:hypothetical protein
MFLLVFFLFFLFVMGGAPRQVGYGAGVVVVVDAAALSRPPVLAFLCGRRYLVELDGFCSDIYLFLGVGQGGCEAPSSAPLLFRDDGSTWAGLAARRGVCCVVGRNFLTWGPSLYLSFACFCCWGVGCARLAWHGFVDLEAKT